MRRLLAIAVTVVGVAWVVAVPAHAGRAVEPRLLDRDCGLLIPTGVEVDCHWLLVPETRSGRAAERELRIAVMVLHAEASAPKLDPIVFLQGGPGGDAILGFESFLTSPMHEDRDIVLFDQRGAGMSEPSLNCPEREAAERIDFSRAEPHDVELEMLRDATQACRDRLIDEGVDLNAFDTRESAADVADLRIALGYDEWNLYGVSYGTRLALEVMRSFPEGIRSAVLDSVYPTDVVGIEPYIEGMDLAFGRLVAACNADVSCAEQQPDLGLLIDQAVERYNANPAQLTASNGDVFTVTGDDVYAGFWDAMYDSALIPALPSFIEAIAQGDVGFLQVLAEEADFGLDAEGMFLSVECADGGVVDVPVDPGRAAVVVRYSAQSYCDLWDVQRVPRRFNRPVRSKIPTLVLAGSLDPITPASDSRRAAEALRNATYVELAGLGHVVTNGIDCPRAIRQVFLADPEAELSDADLACAKEPAPPFLSQGLI